jgi:hypothetical protein
VLPMSDNSGSGSWVGKGSGGGSINFLKSENVIRSEYTGMYVCYGVLWYVVLYCIVLY